MIKNMLLFKNKSVLFAEEDAIARANMTGILLMLFGQVFSASNGEEAYALYKNESPDILITDIKISKKSGTVLIRRIRQDDNHTPIILLSDTTEQALLAHITDVSIDGYLVKPIEPEKLTHAICKAIQRTPKYKGLTILTQELLYNLDTQELCRNGTVIDLGVKEQELLKLLISNYHRTVTKKEIANTLWPAETQYSSAVKNIVLRLRKKLESDILISVRGIGYRLDTNKI